MLTLDVLISPVLNLFHHLHIVFSTVGGNGEKKRDNYKKEGEDKGAKNNLAVEILVTSHGSWLRTRENTKSVGIM